MNRRRKIQLMSIISAGIVLGSVVSSRIDVNNRKKDNNSEETFVEETTTYEPIVYEFHYYNDTIDENEEINKLGIVNDSSSPYNCYKYIRFVDFDSRERYAIVKSYVDYILDEDKKVIDTIYTFVDAFDGKVLFTTKDYRKISEFNSDIIWYLMECGDLLELKDSVISKGLDINYANSVMSSDIENKSLSIYDVARYYVLLVNSKNRLEKEYVMNIG